MKKRLFLLIACILCIPGASFGLDTANSLIYPEYSKTISMDFKDAILNDVLKIFSQQSGLNFIASDNVADKKVTLFLDKVPVEEALERILTANGLAYEIESGSNIFIVKPATRTPDDVLTRVYTLKYATVSSSKLNSTVSITPDGATASAASTGLQTGTDGSGIVSAMKAVLSQKGSIVEDPRTNSLIITDSPAQFQIIEQTISRLDVPIPQVLIEVEMLDVAKDVGEQMGIKYGSTPLTFQGAERDILYPFNQNAVINKYLLTSGAQPPAASADSTTTTTTSTSTTDSVDPPLEPEYRVGTLSAAGLTAALHFLKSHSDTKNLARPRILTLNNETAQIQISTNEAIGIQTNTQAAEGSATQSVSAERVNTGIFLTVTPQVNLLTREITMAIVPKVIQARTGGTFSGTTFKDPEERGTKSILRMRDNDTIVLGGLLRSDNSNTITKLPILGDLPLVGMAFRHKERRDTERELIIFITPRITDTFSSDLAMTKPEKITREQELPPTRLREIEEALTTAEKQKR